MTTRELEILEALSERLTNKEIGARLFISTRTVESHVASLMRKLAVTRRRELGDLWSSIRLTEGTSSPSLPPPLQLLADPDSIVGRRSERTRLRDLWQQAKRGQLVVALVVGEAGIGKSRIAAEIALEVQEDGGAVQLGSCFDDLDIPYEPFVQVIRADALRLDDADLAQRCGNVSEAVGRLVPEIAMRLAGAEVPSLADGQSERASLLAGVHGYLSAMALDAPQLVVIEDLHWSTTTTRDVVRLVCRSNAPVPMLLLMTSRDGPPDVDEAYEAFLSDIRRQPVVEVLQLAGLSEPEIADLLSTTVSARPANEIHAETDGNPLLALEAARSATGSGVLAGVLASRYDRLARAELEVLDVAVILGSEFDAALVAAAAGRSVEESVKALEAAEQAGLVVALPGRPGRFAFVHALYRVARYDSLPTLYRLQLHRSVAIALRPWANDAQMLPILAHHSCAAATLGDADEALEYAWRAGHAARRKFALDEAAEQFREALAMLELIPSADPLTRLRLEIDLGKVRWTGGEPSGRAQLLAAVNEARTQGDHEALAEATLALGRPGSPWGGGGSPDASVASAFQATLSTIPSGPSRTRALLLAGLSSELGIDGQILHAREISRQALDMARELDDLPTVGQVLLGYRVLIHEPALSDERADLGRELLELGRSLDDPALTYGGLSHLFNLHREAGDLNGMERVRRQLDNLGAINLVPFARMNEIAREATDLYLSGDLAGAEACIDRFAGEGTIFDYFFSNYSIHLLTIRYQQGRLVELLPLLEQFAAQQPQDRAFQAALVVAFARAGEVAAATQALESLSDEDYDMPHNANWFVGTEVLADGVELLGNKRAAQILLDRLLPFAGRLADHLYGVTRPADHAVAQLMLTLGDFDGAARVAAHAIQASRDRKTPIFLGRELVLLAEARHRAGASQPELQPLIDEANEIACMTGAHLIDQEIVRYGLIPAR